MAAAIHGEFPDAEVQLIRGGGGVFTVEVEGRRLWDKKQSGRFPEDDEILRELR